MRMKAALLCLLIAAVAGAETFDIKLKTFPDKNKTVTVQSRDRMETKITFRDTSGKETGKDESETVQVEEYKQTTLDTRAGRLMKFSREYAKASASSGKKSRDLTFAGKTVTFTAGDKGCSHDLKAEKMPDAEKQKLADADSDGLELVAKLLPGKPVAVGGTWEISGKQVAGVLKTLKVDPEKSKGQGKLVGIEKKGGKLVGTLNFKLELATMEEKGEGKADGTFELTVVAPIDASGTEARITIKTAIKLETSFTDEGKETKATVIARGEYSGDIGEEK